PRLLAAVARDHVLVVGAVAERWGVVAERIEARHARAIEGVSLGRHEPPDAVDLLDPEAAGGLALDALPAAEAVHLEPHERGGIERAAAVLAHAHHAGALALLARRERAAEAEGAVEDGRVLASARDPDQDLVGRGASVLETRAELELPVRARDAPLGD